MSRLRQRPMLLAFASLSAIGATQGHAQSAPVPQAQDEEEEIVVTGARERGAVIGDIKPVEQLNAADVRALGVSSISELLTELGPQVQSASGKPPVTLLEGKRVSSFREIASIPAEAIARVDILPEEVSLRYGYSPDQKVVNIVLRQRFRAFSTEVDGRIPSGGEGKSLELDGGFLGIRRGHRVNISAQYTTQDGILESERGLTRPESVARTLRPASEQLTLNGSYNRPLDDRTQATLSSEIVTTRSESNVGLTLPAVIIPGGTPYASGAADSSFYPNAAGLPKALDRSSSTQSGQIGLTLNAQRESGQWTLAGTYSRQDVRGITGQPYDLTAYAAAVARGDATANPAQDIQPMFLVARPADETQSRTDTGNLDLLYNRTLFSLPAGMVAATAKISGSTMELESSLERNFVVTSRRLSRQGASGSLSLDFPLTSASSAIGRLSANANGGLDHYSDVGTLRSFGFGFNWAPHKGIAFTGNYRDEESAPTPSQLGDPRVVTPFVPVFDYVRGETALVTTISGGNSALANARARNFRLGAVLTPLQDPSVSISLDYSHRSTTGGIANFPGITADTAAAFPGRFIRDSNGRLTEVDLRPINITSQKRDALRWGINFSKRLKTPQSQIDAMRAAFQRRFPNGVPGRPDGQQGEPPAPAPPGSAGATPPPPGGAVGPPGDGPPRGFGGPRAFGGGGGGGGGRINFAVYHEWVFTNTTQLASTLPTLDLLDGDTLGNGAGPSRHSIEVQAGVSQSGYGLRLTGNWKSATHINGIVGVPSSQLRFGDLATVNLRLFANLTQMPKLIEKMPLLRGVRVQLGVDNLFNVRQRVTDGNGAVPFAYQPAFIDPLGRVIRISIRKLMF
ncbi:MAG: TonB-dependent receptor [Sphingomonas sp.]|nr:TonB-dependent receptor [Sphingomonas sp.]